MKGCDFLLSSDFKSNTATHGTIEFLLRRMRHKGDLPAFSQNIIEINKKLSSLHAINFSSSGELASIILKDISLTNKLLKVVNSSLYGSVSGKVTTVSRAVFLLGAEKVRIVAASLMILDHLQDKSQASDLKDASMLSFFSAVLARNVAEKIMFSGVEEVFICALLHNLGKHLVICYFPEEYHEIKNLTGTKGLAEQTASKKVLGISYSELGMGVSKSWGFPQIIVGSMEIISEQDTKVPDNDLDILKSLANYANELCAAAVHADTDSRNEAIRAIAEKYKTKVPYPVNLIGNLMEDAVVDIDHYAEAFNIDKSKSLVLRRLSAFQETDESEETADNGLKKISLSLKTSRPEITKKLSAKEKKNKMLKNCIFEINELLTTPCTTSDAMYMILETMYRAFEFNRVIFCLLDANHLRMTARFGFGENIEILLEHFHFKVSRSSDFFNLAVLRRKDFIVQDSNKAGICENLPGWYLNIITSGSFLILPLIVKEKCIGLFYADKKTSEILSDDERDYMNILRDKAIWTLLHKR